jgi:hypothetical protein
MVCFHGRYNLGDKTDLKPEQFSGWDELEEHLKEECKATHILPLFLYEHGNITMNTSGFHCPWDSGQVGFIYATEETIKESGVNPEGVDKWLQEEVKIYDQYLCGDVYGYIIEDTEGNHVDSCWGFYGHDYALSEAQEALETLEAQEYERAITLGG